MASKIFNKNCFHTGFDREIDRPFWWSYIGHIDPCPGKPRGWVFHRVFNTCGQNRLYLIGSEGKRSHRIGGFAWTK